MDDKGRPPRTEEGALAASARAGNLDAYGALYRSIVAAVHDFLRRTARDEDVAADLAQETFMRGFAGLDGLGDPDNVRAWLFSIAHGLAVEHLRDNPAPSESLPEGGTPDPGASSLTEAEQAQMAGLVWAAAETLDREQYALLDLTVRQGVDIVHLTAWSGDTGAREKVPPLTGQLRDAQGALGRALRDLLIRRSAEWCTGLDDMAKVMGERMTAKDNRRIDDHLRRCPKCRPVAERVLAPGALACLAQLPLPDSIGRDGWERLAWDLVRAAPRATTGAPTIGAPVVSAPPVDPNQATFAGMAGVFGVPSAADEQDFGEASSPNGSTMPEAEAVSATAYDAGAAYDTGTHDAGATYEEPFAYGAGAGYEATSAYEAAGTGYAGGVSFGAGDSRDATTAYGYETDDSYEEEPASHRLGPSTGDLRADRYSSRSGIGAAPSQQMPPMMLSQSSDKDIMRHDSVRRLHARVEKEHTRSVAMWVAIVVALAAVGAYILINRHHNPPAVINTTTVPTTVTTTTTLVRATSTIVATTTTKKKATTTTSSTTTTSTTTTTTTIPPPIPFVTSINPVQGYPGAAVVIHGGNFVPGDEVAFTGPTLPGGTEVLTPTSVSPNSISSFVPSFAVFSGQQLKVAVENSNSKMSTSSGTYKVLPYWSGVWTASGRRVSLQPTTVAYGSSQDGQLNLFQTDVENQQCLVDQSFQVFAPVAGGKPVAVAKSTNTCPGGEWLLG